MKDTKGFTLVELLAVIVILAVVMLIASTAIGPLMDKSRQGALGSEGLSMIDAAKMAYQIDTMNGAITSTTVDVCYDIAYLYKNQYFEKGTGNLDSGGDGYTGSVYIEYENQTYNYYFWISNGSYSFEGVTPADYKSDAAKEGASTSSKCCTTGGKCAAAGTVFKTK